MRLCGHLRLYGITQPMDSSIRAGWQLRIKTKDFEIDEIGVEEGVDLGLGIKDSLLPNIVL